MKTVVFIGHNECYGINKSDLRQIIVRYIENGAVEFLSGGQGGFDIECAIMVFELKKLYPQIKNILVIPYLNFNVFNKKYFDEIVYPDGFEKYHYKAAILKRNRYMVDAAQAAVCYVGHKWGGAYKTFEYAKQKNIELYNLCNSEYI